MIIEYFALNWRKFNTSKNWKFQSTSFQKNQNQFQRVFSSQNSLNILRNDVKSKCSKSARSSSTVECISRCSAQISEIRLSETTVEVHRFNGKIDENQINPEYAGLFGRIWSQTLKCSLSHVLVILDLVIAWDSVVFSLFRNAFVQWKSMRH